jgi:hypothetical protein
MSGKQTRLSQLQLRKQLLIAESDLNRALLLQEYQTLAGGLRGLTDRARAFSTIGSSIIPFAAGLVRFVRRKAPPPASNSSWFPKVLSGARLAFAIWRIFRSRGSAPEKSSQTTVSVST